MPRNFSILAISKAYKYADTEIRKQNVLVLNHCHRDPVAGVYGCADEISKHQKQLDEAILEEREREIMMKLPDKPNLTINFRQNMND